MGRYVLLLSEGGIEDSLVAMLAGAHSLCGYGEIQRTSEPLASGEIRRPHLLRSSVSSQPCGRNQFELEEGGDHNHSHSTPTMASRIDS